MITKVLTHLKILDNSKREDGLQLKFPIQIKIVDFCFCSVLPTKEGKSLPTNKYEFFHSVHGETKS